MARLRLLIVEDSEDDTTLLQRPGIFRLSSFPAALNRVAPVSFLLAALLTVPPSLWAQPRPPAEHDVEAAYLYQFGRYVEWPASQGRPGRPFAICVLGKDPFGSALDEIVKGKVISDHPVETKRLLAPAESQDCQILFVSPSEDDRLPAILKALEGRTVLTVGEGTQFTRRGGMVAFTLTDRKVRFVVNLAAVETAQLKLSSQLLRLAASVEP